MKLRDNQDEKANEEQSTWQVSAIQQLSQHFQHVAKAQAFVLTGSLGRSKKISLPKTVSFLRRKHQVGEVLISGTTLATEDGPVDVWSDVDAKIILAEEAVARYYGSTAWLAPFGQIIGLERHEHPLTKTLRVCLADFRRFDLTFIAAESLQTPDAWDHNPIPAPYTIL
ncbi:MAG: hypothetical protein GVY30_03585, partial [Chloroflexi bacterium]|nr:hypothetical protein [Chloroflexota bacterium]